MGPNQEHADDASTGPLPIIGPDGRPGFGAPPGPPAGPQEDRGGGGMPPPEPGEAPGAARERLAADVPPAEPSEAPAEPPHRRDFMAAAVLGAVLVLVAGVVAARLWP
ncbi:hypothetical protein ACFVH6_01685 [Spirillospora sp. NPDC127200]